MKRTPIIFTLCLIVLSFTNVISQENIQAEMEKESSENITNQNKNSMKNQISTFLTFQDNNAENAMNFYVELFENSKIVDVKR